MGTCVEGPGVSVGVRVVRPPRLSTDGRRVRRPSGRTSGRSPERTVGFSEGPEPPGPLVSCRFQNVLGVPGLDALGLEPRCVSPMDTLLVRREREVLGEGVPHACEGPWEVRRVSDPHDRARGHLPRVQHRPRLIQEHFHQDGRLPTAGDSWVLTGTVDDYGVPGVGTVRHQSPGIGTDRKRVTHRVHTLHPPTPGRSDERVLLRPFL